MGGVRGDHAGLAGKITIPRAAHSTTLLAGFVLVAVMSPCRCGFVENPRSLHPTKAGQPGQPGLVFEHFFRESSRGTINESPPTFGDSLP